MPTVCHNEDADEASWKLYYYKNTHIFQCYTECGSMSIFTFLKNFYETRNITYDWYTDVYQLILGCSYFREEIDSNSYRAIRDNYTDKKARRELPSYSPLILDSFIKYYPTEWLEDGISKAAMDKFNIRFSISQNKIIIPHYNIDGELIGIRGRALDEWEIENIGKYKPVQIEQKWYKHPLSLNLYGLNKTKENIKKYGICYVGEAEKFVLQCESFSFPNCSVAVCGSQFNKYQLNLLMKYCQPREIVIFFDKEEKEGEHKYFDKLMKICEKYKNYCNFSFVYDRENLIGMKDSPSDRGEEIFKKLIERRVSVK